MPATPPSTRPTPGARSFESPGITDPRADEASVIVSCDAHIGPRLVDELRSYCPRRHLDAFDDFAAQAPLAWAELQGEYAERASEEFQRNSRTEGHHDMAARRADLDRDGVAAEVIFHGSQNGQPLPFQTFTDVAGAPPIPYPPELVAAGIRMYNRWLADAVGTDPHRHVGLAQLPMWDVDAAVAEARWAADVGLGGVNLPAPRPDLAAPYNDRAWEPLWSACAELRLPLATHAGSAGATSRYSGPEAEAIQALEHGGWYARRGLHWLVLSGVFERHPGLALVLTEQPGIWWTSTLSELDSVWTMQRAALADQVPEPPSHYCRTNVWIGASFLARFEAEDAWQEGYSDRVMWGSDYPHMEGTFQHPRPGELEPMGRLALRSTFASIPPGPTATMLGGNAVDVFHLDLEQLRSVAAHIGAPTPADLARPLTTVPEGGGLLAFRQFGPWA